MSAARTGDRDALDALLRRHYDRVFALCRRVMGNQTDAADAAQEALIALSRGLARFDGRSSFTTWSYRVAMNACLDELRRRRRRPEPGLPDENRSSRALDPGAMPLADEVVARLTVDEGLRTLPVEFRAAVVLRDVCALDYAEIAEVLEIPPGTVRSRIARGRALLAARIGGNPTPDPDRQNPSR